MMENLNFKEWMEYPNDSKENTETEVLNLYFHSNLKIQEISSKTNVSIGEIYRILHKSGKPNRKNTNHDNVLLFHTSKVPIKKIAEFTGYSPRNVRYILARKNKE